MLYIIFCLDKPNHEQKRLDHYEAHKAYLQTLPYQAVMSGPLTTDDDKTMIGSFFLVDADSRKLIEATLANDPFSKAGIWQTVEIRRFRKRVG
jgi:uncharacterized protein